jgi:hypothetical protein
VFEVSSLLGIPALRRWAAHKAGHAYHHGFIHNLIHDSKATMLAVVDHEESSHTSAASRDGAARPLQTAV